MNEQPAIYAITIRASEKDLDQLGHVNNVVYVQWVQDVAESHWHSLTTPEIRNQIVWVVIRHEIDYRKSALNGDRLTLTTWVGETEGVRSVRYVKITNEKKQLIAEARTTWCMIDPITRRPKRITENISMLFILKKEN